MHEYTDDLYICPVWMEDYAKVLLSDMQNIYIQLAARWVRRPDMSAINVLHDSLLYPTSQATQFDMKGMNTELLEL